MVTLTIVEQQRDRFRALKIGFGIIFYVLTLTAFTTLVKEYFTESTIWTYAAILLGAVIVLILLLYPVYFLLAGRKTREAGTVTITGKGLDFATENGTEALRAPEIEAILLTYRGYLKVKGKYALGKSSTLEVRKKRGGGETTCEIAVPSKKERRELRSVLEELDRKKIEIEVANATHATWQKF